MNKSSLAGDPGSSMSKRTSRLRSQVNDGKEKKGKVEVDRKVNIDFVCKVMTKYKRYRFLCRSTMS
jgi:hypothetical protein